MFLIALPKAFSAEYEHIMPSGTHLNLANEYGVINDRLESIVPSEEANANMVIILEWLKSDDMNFFNNIPLQEALLVFSSLRETEGPIRCSERSYDIIGENQQWISRMPHNNFQTKSRIVSVFEQYAKRHAEHCTQLLNS